MCALHDQTRKRTYLETVPAISLPKDCTFPSCFGKHTQSRRSNISYLAPSGHSPRHRLTNDLSGSSEAPRHRNSARSKNAVCYTMWSNVEQCRARLSNVEHCGAMWSSLKQCGAVWSNLEQCSCVRFMIRPGSAHNWRPCQP